MTGLHLRATLEKRHLDLEFEVAPGEVVAILGANGAGKSTVLHVIAGLLQPDSGSVTAGTRCLTDVAGGVRVPVHARRIGLLQQDPMLFPHLDVAANVAFGPRCGGDRRRAAEAARRWLAEVDAGELGRRRPSELSGGQAQRVALARALATEPDVLLLDEPMAGLDVTAAASMRTLLREVLTEGGRCAVLVTHELLDVTALADRVLILDRGRIAESGSPASVLAAPVTAFGARFAGVNLLTGMTQEPDTLLTAGGHRLYGRRAAGPAPTRDQPAIAVFAPAAVEVHRQRPLEQGAATTFEVSVAELDHRGSAIRVRAEPLEAGATGLAADISVQLAAQLRLIPGERVYFRVAADEVTIRPAV
ncbi:molybdate transport system ATP-binding protein [Mycobacterium sp. MAA66]|uniref:sulfate/molybdate ABC transporter ATP-binding protein n=1 Tax=Mycobacterium sp. MAA66 TaxID=3156297 RepID=UPI0035134CC5